MPKSCEKSSAEELETTAMAGILRDDEEVSMETRVTSPAHFLVKIESFSLLSEHAIRVYESKEFAAGDYKWKLLIYVDGHQHQSENNKDNISVDLAMAGADSLPVGWEVNAIFNVLLYNHILDNYLCFRGRVHRFHTMKSKWGFSKLISKKRFMDPFNGYLVNDNCVFGAEVFVIKSPQVMECLSLKKCGEGEKHVIEISNFSQLKDPWYSEEFEVGSCKWKIQLNPNGIRDKIGKSVSIFLLPVDLASHQKVKAAYCLRIRNQLNDDNVSFKATYWFTTPLSGWGWPSFVSIADMRDGKKGLVVEDRCVLEAEISVQAVVRDGP